MVSEAPGHRCFQADRSALLQLWDAWSGTEQGKASAVAVAEAGQAGVSLVHELVGVIHVVKADDVSQFVHNDRPHVIATVRVLDHLGEVGCVKLDLLSDIDERFTRRMGEEAPTQPSDVSFEPRDFRRDGPPSALVCRGRRRRSPARDPAIPAARTEWIRSLAGGIPSGVSDASTPQGGTGDAGR